MSELTIVVVAYNRKHALKRCLQALSKALYPEQVKLVISIDRGDQNEAIWEAAKEFVWEHGDKRVIYREENLGLRNHILKCGDLAHKYKKIILLEDDIYVSPDFYDYAVQASRFYSNNPIIAGISLYSPRFNESAKLPFEPIDSPYDVFFSQLPTSWGQVWTSEQWKAFKRWYTHSDRSMDDFKESSLPLCVSRWPLTSWKKYFSKYMSDQDKYFVYPYVSLSTNFGDAGTHFKRRSHHFQVPLSNCGLRKYKLDPFSSASVVYDGSFENKGLRDCFDKLVKRNLSVDLYATKHEKSYKRFVLTTKKLNYQIMQMFDLTMKPIEDNVRLGIPGQSVYLYDTSASQPFPDLDDQIPLESYFSWEKLK